MVQRRSRPTPDPVGPGQESVWAYPRPPRLEPCAAAIRVELDGVVIADTLAAFRVLETSHPPSYYLPPDDCDLRCFAPAPGRSFCEWKGNAVYWTVTAGDRVAERAAWSYPDPTSGFAPIRDHLAFYPSVFECFVGDEAVTPQPGGFYGGWVTAAVAGPVKGPPGTEWW